METKQTAVEWLYERLERMIPRTALYNIDKKDYFEKAKAMEKEQIIEFANKVIYNAECSFTGMAYLEKDINEIYNETYEN